MKFSISCVTPTSLRRFQTTVLSILGTGLLAASVLISPMPARATWITGQLTIENPWQRGESFAENNADADGTKTLEIINDGLRAFAQSNFNLGGFEEDFARSDHGAGGTLQQVLTWIDDPTTTEPPDPQAPHDLQVTDTFSWSLIGTSVEDFAGVYFGNFGVGEAGEDSTITTTVYGIPSTVNSTSLMGYVAAFSGREERGEGGSPGRWPWDASAEGKRSWTIDELNARASR